MLFMLVKSRGASIKVLIALFLGGGIAFFLYYFRAMIGYLDVIVGHFFFDYKAYAYQIPSTSFGSLLINFGFILFVGLAGIFVAFKMSRVMKKPIFFLILLVSVIVPLFLAESYFFGLYLPFHWFLYYLMPPLVVLTAVSLVFLAGKTLKFLR